MSKEDIQKKYIELQLLEQQIQQLQQQLLILEEQLVNLERTKDNINELKDVKEGSEVFLPIGIGVYASGQLKDNKGLLVNIGSNVAVKKNVSETKAIIDKQINEISNITRQLESVMHKASQQARVLQGEIQELLEKEHNK